MRGSLNKRLYFIVIGFHQSTLAMCKYMSWNTMFPLSCRQTLPYQHFNGFFSGSCPKPSTKVGAYRVCTFCIILLTIKQTRGGTQSSTQLRQAPTVPVRNHIQICWIRVKDSWICPFDQIHAQIKRPIFFFCPCSNLLPSFVEIRPVVFA